MENTRPNQSIQLVIRVVYALAVDVEVEIEVPSDGIHVIVYVVNFLSFPHDIDVVHFAGGHFSEGFNQLLSQLECELVLRKVPQPLVNKPNMHVNNGVVYVEIRRDIHSVYELPRITVHHNTLQQGVRLHH